MNADINVVVPQALALVLPFLVTMLSSYLRGSHRPLAVNGAIALVCIVITALVCVWLSGQWTGNFRETTLLVIGYVALFMRNDFQSVMNWLFYQNSATIQPEIPVTVENKPAIVPTKDVA